MAIALASAIYNDVRSQLISYLPIQSSEGTRHFTLVTKDGDQIHDQGQSLYSRFIISGKDITTFFTDCGVDVQNCSLVRQSSISPDLEDQENHSSLVDRCGTAIIVVQIKVPHPRHPSTRISIQVPSLGIHLSPVRYHRLIQLLDIFYGTVETSEQLVVESSQSSLGSWNSPNLASEARILIWKGIGYSVAAWQPCYLVLSGVHLYVMESEVSRSYQRSSRLSVFSFYIVSEWPRRCQLKRGK